MLASIDTETRSLLLRTARDAIRVQLLRRSADSADLGDDGSTRVDDTPGDGDIDASGVFVTVFVAGALRGCIGFLALQGGLLDTVAEAARRAAAEDPRFPSVEADELEELDIDVTLMGPLEKLSSAEDFDIGRHGLVIEQRGNRGLLLPQVATERRWDKAEFLSALCHKARLPDRAWENADATLSRFEGLVIREDDGRERR
jgi:uncharacterized protein